MNKKQLIITGVAGSALLCFFMLPAFAAVVPTSSPDYKKSKYDYKEDDKPDAYFFPKDKAKWDGYKVSNWDWIGLTALQKDMFISEGIAEIERTKNATVTLEKKWRLLSSMNTTASDMIADYPKAKKPMIDILLDSLKENGFIKFL